MTTDQIISLAGVTSGQRNNPEWAKQRSGRITSSNYGIVLAAIRRNRYPPSLFKTLLDSYNLETIRAIQWGINHENAAISAIEAATGHKIMQIDLWLHSLGLLGASPGGLVDSDFIIEIKCPYKYRDSSIKDLVMDSSSFTGTNEQGLYYYRHHLIIITKFKEPCI